MLTQVAKEKPEFLFVSAVPPFALSHARSICRRARQRVPDVKPIICFWASKENSEDVRNRLGTGCSDYVVNSLSQAELQLRLFNAEPQGEAAQAKGQEQTAAEREEVETGR